MNPDSWSFALKSSDSPTGKNTIKSGWQKREPKNREYANLSGDTTCISVIPDRISFALKSDDSPASAKHDFYLPLAYYNRYLVSLHIYLSYKSGLEVIKLFSCSAEIKIYPAHKC